MDDPALWHRLQFAFTITYHYLFPQLTMGLALILVIWRFWYLRTKDERIAMAARFWTRDITMMIVIAVASAVAAGIVGLLISFHASVPSGPAVILTAGALCIVSGLFGRVGGAVWNVFPGRHLEA